MLNTSFFFILLFVHQRRIFSHSYFIDIFFFYENIFELFLCKFLFCLCSFHLLLLRLFKHLSLKFMFVYLMPYVDIFWNLWPNEVIRFTTVGRYLRRNGKFKFLGIKMSWNIDTFFRCFNKNFKIFFSYNLFMDFDFFFWCYFVKIREKSLAFLLH